VLADWSKLVNKKYTTLQDSFDVLLRDRTSIHGIILIGDIGYDLETNECQNYLGFLEILEQVASVWPVIIVTGNHEYVSKKNWDLYVKSF
jgi:metallophosphoesterase superfamily enzyme